MPNLTPYILNVLQGSSGMKAKDVLKALRSHADLADVELTKKMVNSTLYAGKKEGVFTCDDATPPMWRCV